MNYASQVKFYMNSLTQVTGPLVAATKYVDKKTQVTVPNSTADRCCTSDSSRPTDQLNIMHAHQTLGRYRLRIHTFTTTQCTIIIFTIIIGYIWKTHGILFHYSHNLHTTTQNEITWFFCFIRLKQRGLLLNWCDFQVIKMIQKNILAQLNHQAKYKIIQTVSLPNVPGKKTKQKNLRTAQTPTALYKPFGHMICCISSTAFLPGPN